MATKKKKKTQDKASMIKNATERAKKIKNIRRIERGLGIRGAASEIDYAAEGFESPIGLTGPTYDFKSSKAKKKKKTQDKASMIKNITKKAKN